ncbi:probable LRR receptor-like serine/threonine-protein kinase At1g05700 [Hibiscus syriacus]|uniref:probable LRR receptor-like serine/threonine-protein kinase At1g05700 n=1 Tax=Hibiscus syriacus TaxID=106335 RepID=UPI00192297DC|nr:probable LRR receptor-like serine/threonine-protein kinase At1g05700 [Hibiscus syriacus]
MRMIWFLILKQNIIVMAESAHRWIPQVDRHSEAGSYDGHCPVVVVAPFLCSYQAWTLINDGIKGRRLRFRCLLVFRLFLCLCCRRNKAVGKRRSNHRTEIGQSNRKPGFDPEGGCIGGGGGASKSPPAAACDGGTSGVAILELCFLTVDAITDIKSIYGVKRNWKGEPCAPKTYSWDGLNCSYDGSGPPRIISLNLSSSELTGKISASISKLAMLQHLDLSNNSLTGDVPDFLLHMPLLSILNLEGNKLSGSLPVALMERSNNGSLLLSVGENPDLCLTASCQRKEKHKNKLVVPLAASAIVIFVILAALAAFWSLRRRKQEVVTKVSAEDQNKGGTTLESINRKFTYSKVLKITDNFVTVLGRGGFGTVFLGCLDNTQVAVKMLSKSSVQGSKEFHAEVWVKLLMRVHHANLTNLVGYCNEGSHMGLIYEYMANGNLKQHLSDRDAHTMSWEERLRIAVDAAQGLEYGSNPPIVHRDVKSANILLNEKFQAKLADFGLSRAFPAEGGTHVSTIVAGTPGYLDPEYLTTNRLNEKSDVFSFGVVLLEIFTSRPVITIWNDEATHISQWVSSLLAKGDIKGIVDPRLGGNFEINSAWKVVELALGCACRNSTDRPTMSEVVMELKECLKREVARNRGVPGPRTSGLRRGISINLDTEPSPRAR